MFDFSEQLFRRHLRLMGTSKNYEFRASQKRKWLILLIGKLQNMDYWRCSYIAAT